MGHPLLDGMDALVMRSLVRVGCVALAALLAVLLLGVGIGAYYG